MPWRLDFTPFRVIVDAVIPLSVSTCFLMSARAEHTWLVALSCLDSPQPASSAAAVKAATTIERVMVSSWRGRWGEVDVTVAPRPPRHVIRSGRYPRGGIIRFR